jgi:hypothetical protein
MDTFPQNPHADSRVLVCCSVGKHVRSSGRDNHLDGVFDAISCVAECGGQIGKRKRMGMDFRRVEPFFRHECHRAARGAATFAANAIDIDIVLDEVRDIGRHRLVRERGEADLAAAIGHVNGLIDRGLGACAFDDIIRADPAGELPYDTDRILLSDVDDAVGTELPADREATVARSR